MKSKYLVYEDCYITIFHDVEKYMLVFVNDCGECKAISYDDNFYSVEEDILTYKDLIERSFRGVQSEEKDFYFRKFVKHIERQLKNANQELNWEYLEFNGVKQEA